MSNTHLSPDALAQRWEVSPATLERWRSEGIGPRYLKLRGTIRYRLEDVESFEFGALRHSTHDVCEVAACA